MRWSSCLAICNLGVIRVRVGWSSEGWCKWDHKIQNGQFYRDNESQRWRWWCSLINSFFWMQYFGPMLLQHRQNKQEVINTECWNEFQLTTSMANKKSIKTLNNKINNMLTTNRKYWKKSLKDDHDERIILKEKEREKFWSGLKSFCYKIMIPWLKYWPSRAS